MNVDEVHRVLIVGSGTMGQQIGLQCAMHGFQVTLYDIDPQALESAMRNIRSYADELLGAGFLDEGRRSSALSAIETSTDPEKAASDADLVSESVPEDPALKGSVFAQFNALCPTRTVFTTNTSTLIPSMFANETGRPDRFAAFHFHQPVWTSNVVDVMPHPGTSAETVDLLLALARRIGQIPIHLRQEHYSYVFNSMLGALNGEALSLAADGVASVEDVDRAWMGIMKMPVGPFGIMDLVGLDTVWDITDFWARQLGDPRLRKNADFVKAYLDKGDLGIKSGQGFYQYPNPAFQQPGFVESGSP
ncbi:MAG TPA: 3-hydroxyacyl-CoA dehydrogenase [Actinomycetota bacterium]